MANIQGTFFSPSISRSTTFQIVLPNDIAGGPDPQNPHFKRPMKTLLLLHGYCGYCNDWLYHANICALAAKYNIAIVLPSGDNSFYLNAPASNMHYEDFLCKDLIDYLQKTFSLAKSPEDTYIGGLSMGGFGAIHSGLAHPETFSKMFGLSSAMIADEVCEMKPGTHNDMANYDYYATFFGNPKELRHSHNHPKYLVEERLAKGERIQPIFMACGSEDFLIEPNRDFKKFLEEKKVDFIYKESTGIHDWNFWNEYIEPAIKWCVE